MTGGVSGGFGSGIDGAGGGGDLLCIKIGGSFFFKPAIPKESISFSGEPTARPAGLIVKLEFEFFVPNSAQPKLNCILSLMSPMFLKYHLCVLITNNIGSSIFRDIKIKGGRGANIS